MEPLVTETMVLPCATRVAYLLMHHMHARVCTKPSISYSNHPFFQQSITPARTPPGGGPSWAYLPYLQLESEARERRDESQAMQAFMRACVCTDHPISPLIIVQSPNMSLYSMFALLHCTFTMTRDKQCACCIRSKQDLYVYTLFFEFILSFLNSLFFIALRSKRRMPTSIIIVCLVIFLLLRDILL